MPSRITFEIAEKLLKTHHQSHILAFWEQLNNKEQQNLLAQIDQLDFGKISDWIADFVKNPAANTINADFQPASSYSPAPTQKQEKKYDEARKLGKKLISEGKVAAFVVAGGQGTRLGFDGPKGNFPISPVKNKTLFQLFAESIAAAAKKYQAPCPWYIMTSPLNHKQTTDIFKANNYFGMDEKDIFIFQQGTMPIFDFEGKLLMSDKSTIAVSPDGHGGSLKALYESGAIEDMKNRRIEFVSYFQVDNPLINIFDPLFIGLHALDNAQMSSKALTKTGPLEKVGNFCLVDGKVTVIEYSDLPDAYAEKRNPDGSLVFELGSIAIHIINTSLIEKVNKKGFSLPIHKAIKKVSYINQTGTPIEPDEPNVIILETFVFDALPLASNSIILQTVRCREFGPVKNAAGTDSAETARQMLIERAADWLLSAGVTIPRKSDGSIDAKIEIAADFALEKEDLKEKLDQIPEIKPGDQVYIEKASKP